MTKDIVRTFEVITMAVYNILPDPLIRPSCYDHIGSDEVFKIARCVPRRTGPTLEGLGGRDGCRLTIPILTYNEHNE